jgi:cell division protease FtsH
MGGPEVGVARFVSDKDERQRRADLSESQKDALDRAVRAILEEGRQRAAEILRQNRPLLESLRDLLMEKKTIDAKTLVQFAGEKATPKEPWPEGDPAVGGGANHRVTENAEKNTEKRKERKYERDSPRH